jgi:hypothetical protein
MKRHSLGARVALAMLAAAFAAGCGSTQATTQAQYGGRVPRPARIVVYPFAVSPADVALDDSPTVVAAWKMHGLSANDERREVAEQVRDALAANLVQKIQAMGLPAERYAGQDVSTGGPMLAITGHFLSVDEGSRAARITVGLGAGRSTVSAAVQVFDVMPEGNRLLTEYDVVAKSGRRPGAAETLGVGAAAGTLATAAVVTGAAAVGSEAFGDDVQADARRAAEKIAKLLQAYFAQQGWVQP